MGIRVGTTKIKNVRVEDPDYRPPSQATPWVRNADWIDMPDIPTGDSKAAFLFAVSPILQNRVGVRVNDNYFVDWGDGNSGYHIDNSVTGHQYSFDSLPVSTEFVHTDGYTYRQVIFTVTPSGESIFKKVDIVEDHPDTVSEHYGVRPYLDIHINGPDLTNIYLNSSSANRSLQLEHLKIGNIDSVTDLNSLCYGCEQLQSVEIDDTSNISSWSSAFINCYLMQEYPDFVFKSGCNLNNIFNGNRSLIEVPTGISESYPTTMTSAFYLCTSLKSIPMIDTSNVTSIHQVIRGCSNLEYAPPFDTSNATRLDSYFQECFSLKEVPDNFDTSSVTHSNGLKNLFANCTNLKTIPFIDISSVTNIASMFAGARSLQRIPALDFSNITIATSLFGSCHALETLPYLNMTGVTSFSNMFSECRALRSIDGLPTENGTDFGTVFNSCFALKEIPSGFNTVSASNSSAFDNSFTNTYMIDSLPEGACSGFGNVGVTDYGEAFENTSIFKLPDSFTGINNNASNITTYDQLFSQCHQLKYIPTIDATNATNYTTMFSSCFSLEAGGILSGLTQNVAYRYSKLDREAMTAIFSGLGNASKTIDIRNTPSIDTLTNADKLIATNKGWTITT